MNSSCLDFPSDGPSLNVGTFGAVRYEVLQGVGPNPDAVRKSRQVAKRHLVNPQAVIPKRRAGTRRKANWGNNSRRNLDLVRFGWVYQLHFDRGYSLSFFGTFF